MNNLPNCVIDTIYEYDGRYKRLWNDVICDLNVKISWNNIIIETLIGSYMYCPGELQEIPSFYKFYFERFGNIIVR
jgi:hypothetical protein